MSHAEPTAGSTPRSGVPAEVVERVAAAVAEEASGSKTREALRLAVPAALQRRAAGESYAAIGRGLSPVLGVGPHTAAKWVADWCKVAAAIVDDDDELAQRLVATPVRTGPRRATKSKVFVGFRPTPATVAALEARRGSMSLAQTAEKYVEIGLGRRRTRQADAPATGVPVEVLVDVANEVAALRLELTRQGNNLNQLTRYTHSYRELPLNTERWLTAATQQLQATQQALIALINTTLINTTPGNTEGVV